VHELTWEELRRMLDNAITISRTRRRVGAVSGGELGVPYFLDAVRSDEGWIKLWYHEATNGIEFAKS